MLLPNKKYLLKIMYYPKALKGEYYNPNKEVGCPKRLCKEHTIVFTTDSLSENSLDEWRWLEKHNLRQVYSINGYRDLDRFMFEEARRFIEQFPNSVFLHVAKVLYIEYIAYYAPIKDVSIEMIENSFQFCQDIEKEHPDLLADYLLSLNKRREQIKN